MISTITKTAGSIAAIGFVTTLFPLSASAVITTFTSQASFLADTSSTELVTFDNYSPTASILSPQLFSQGGGFSISASTSSLFPAGTAGGDVFISTNTATDTITIGSFTSGNVSAVGGNFFGTDISGLFNIGDIQVTATDASGPVTQIISNATLTSFLGFTSNRPLSSISISAVQPTTGFTWPTVNNLYVGKAGTTGTSVPEPFTILGTIFGAGYGVALKRKLTKNQQDKSAID
jgi:hypothetical protein